MIIYHDLVLAAFIMALLSRDALSLYDIAVPL